MEELEEQESRGGSFALGAVGSLVGALIGGVIWCAVAVTTEIELGWIAWGLGALAGVGMALGYRQRSVAAGVTAALVAVLGIVAAKTMIFTYTARGELAEFNRSLVMYDLPRKRLEQVAKLAARDANQEAKKRGSCPFDEQHTKWYSESFLSYGALSESELSEALAKFDVWEKEERWKDPQYAHDTLVYLLVYESHPGIWYARKPLPPEEWGTLYRAALEKVDALGPEEQLRECRRRERAARLAYHCATRCAMEQHLAAGDDDRRLKLYEEELAGALATEDEALTAAAEGIEDWDDEGRWADEVWLRHNLTYCWAEQTWREREDKPVDEAPMPGPSWDQCYEEASEKAAGVPGQEVADRVREAERARDERSLAWRQQQKREAQRALASDAASFIAREMFSAYDLLFGALAIASAYRIGSRGRKES